MNPRFKDMYARAAEEADNLVRHAARHRVRPRFQGTWPNQLVGFGGPTYKVFEPQEGGGAIVSEFTRAAFDDDMVLIAKYFFEPCVQQGT